VVNLESTQSVTFSPDGRMLAAGNDAGTIQLWDLTRTVTP
jgi:WD40 repeat protein